VTPGREREEAERGSVSVELVVATPLMLLLTMSVVQFALWAHATHIAQAAANAGVQAARAYTSTAQAGRDDATTILDQLAGTVLTGTHVDASRDATTATVTVTGQAVAVLPGLHLPVRVSVTAPRERVPGIP
jgi:Flp pilus assembly protein TadG